MQDNRSIIQVEDEVNNFFNHRITRFDTLKIINTLKKMNKKFQCKHVTLVDDKGMINKSIFGQVKKTFLKNFL